MQLLFGMVHILSSWSKLEAKKGKLPSMSLPGYSQNRATLSLCLCMLLKGGVSSYDYSHHQEIYMLREMVVHL